MCKRKIYYDNELQKYISESPLLERLEVAMILKIDPTTVDRRTKSKQLKKRIQNGCIRYHIVDNGLQDIVLVVNN